MTNTARYGLSVEQRLRNLVDFAKKYNIPIGTVSWSYLNLNPKENAFWFKYHHSDKNRISFFDEYGNWNYPSNLDEHIEPRIKDLEDTCHSNWRHPPPYIDEEYPDVGYVFGNA